jgi:hypothetical protein
MPCNEYPACGHAWGMCPFDPNEKSEGTPRCGKCGHPCSTGICEACLKRIRDRDKRSVGE